MINVTLAAKAANLDCRFRFDSACPQHLGDFFTNAGNLWAVFEEDPPQVLKDLIEFMEDRGSNAFERRIDKRGNVVWISFQPSPELVEKMREVNRLIKRLERTTWTEQATKQEEGSTDE